MVGCFLFLQDLNVRYVKVVLMYDFFNLLGDVRIHVRMFNILLTAWYYCETETLWSHFGLTVS